MILSIVRGVTVPAFLVCGFSATADARYVNKQIQQCQPQQFCHPVQSVVQQCAPSQVCQQVAYQTQQCGIQQQCNVIMQNVPRCVPQTRCVGNCCQTFQNCMNVQIPQQYCQPRQVCQPTTAYRQVCSTVQKCQPHTVTTQQCKTEQQCKTVTQQVWEADSPTGALPSSPAPVSAPKPVQNAVSTQTAIRPPISSQIRTQPQTAGPSQAPITNTTFLPSPLAANIPLAKVSVNPAITTKNAATMGGYIYPKRTTGTTTTGLSQQQCAALVQALRPDVQGTGSWTPVGQAPQNLRGQSIQNSNLQPGTPIATFMTNGKYPIGSQTMDTAPYSSAAPREPHSGIFIDYLRDTDGKPVGFEMLAQSAGRPAGLEQRLFAPSSQYPNIRVENYQYSAVATSTR